MPVGDIVNQETRRQKYEALRTQMTLERSSFISHWRELNDFILPRRARFFTTDVNKGDRRNQKIIDSTGTLALRTMRSGMMAGITSPAREWKKLTTDDPDLADYGPVKNWLSVVNERMSNMFLRSNLYNALPITYGDLGVFGTSVMFMEEDFDAVMRCQVLPIGSYMIANDDTMRVRVLFREFPLTVRQIVMKFGFDRMTGKPNWNNISDYVHTQWDRGNYEQWVDVCHVIQPNMEYDDKRLLSKYKKFLSCYYEKGSTRGSDTMYMNKDDQAKYLRESGYDYYPALGVRWEVTGEDVYATDCPGMTALGDIKQLQHGEKKSAQAVDKKISPAMVAPTSLKHQKATILPGDITFLDVREGQQGFKPAHEVDFSIKEHEEKQQQVRLRIQRAFYEDLFLMLAQSDRREITAREIEERHEEKLLALGPVLEQLNQDLLDPLIDNAFDFMMRQGLIPPPPPELQQEGPNQLKVEYISIMAQAQKLVGISSIERFAEFVDARVVASKDTSFYDKIDRDQMIDKYGDRLGIDPEIIVPDEKVAQIRADRAKQQQQTIQAENAANMAGAAKNLSETDLSKDSALSRLLAQAQAGQITEGA